MTWHVSCSYRRPVPASRCQLAPDGTRIQRSEEYARLASFARWDDAAAWARQLADTVDQWAPTGAYDISVSEPIRHR